jgi:hypothetical protein
LPTFPFRQRCEGFPQPVIRGKHPVVAVPVLARRRHKVGEPVSVIFEFSRFSATRHHRETAAA